MIKEIKKKKLLRHNEYYDIQETLDKLYVKSNNNSKFTNLIELITDERNILLAYRNIKKNRGSKTPGVNGKTIDNIGSWDNDTLVNYVRSRIKNFIPMKVKFKEIPKPNGKMRPLGIPTIEDRIIQQCIKQILEPICEGKFHKHSYGFRPNRSTKHAIARMNVLINKSKLHYAVDIDIKGFFDNVDHSKLLKQMWSMGIRDKNLLCVISKMLKAEIQGKGIPNKGTPQGGILSPLLSNIVLNELDWWISDQWETFKTRHEYGRMSSGKMDYSHKYRALRANSNIKEVWIIRYADDFKIMCRDYKIAQKIFVATKKWLKERLGLEVSEEKSKVINMRKNYSEFLGLKIKVRSKGKKHVVKSHISDKSITKIKNELKRKITYMKQIQDASKVNMYNATILGQHNYYSMATNVSMDFYRIGYDLSQRLYNQLRAKYSTNGVKSKAYKKFYGNYNFKIIYISGIALYPIQGIKIDNPKAYTQEICNYTRIGRKLIHSKMTTIDYGILRYIMKHPVKGKSQEYNDNRILLYCGQQGKCFITGEKLQIGEMEVHHKKQIRDGGTDKLVYVTDIVHKLVHSSSRETTQRYINKIKLDQNNLEKLNKLRELVGNCSI